MPGVHFLWPWEALKVVTWTYPGQNGKPVVMRTSQLSFENSQMDLPPLSALSKDQIRVTIDGTLMYTVTSMEKAAYESDDVLNLFYQATNQAVRGVVSEFTVEGLQGQDNLIGERVAAYVNDKVRTKGVACSMFLVQSVDIDKKILAANEAIYVRSRQAKMKLEEQEAEHQRELQSVAQRRERDRQERSLQEEAQTHRIRLEEAAARAEAERDKIKFDVLRAAGFSVDQVVELERVRAMHAIAGSSGKVVYAPLPFFQTNNRVLGTE